MAKLDIEYAKAIVAAHPLADSVTLENDGSLIVYAAIGCGWSENGDTWVETRFPPRTAAKHFILELSKLKGVPASPIEVEELTEEEMQEYQADCEGDAKAQMMKEENDDA